MPITGRPATLHIMPAMSRKWQEIYDELPKMRPVKYDDQGATWKGFYMQNKKVAGGAATSVSSHCYRILKCKDEGWRIQTSIEMTEDGQTILWIRKVFINGLPKFITPPK